ncbi:hypothetical protein BRD00_04235 [Halobacteriales archaeon QS_8_69_26]|nr:MAG: hypothetical protein BRD00_04235 [Halobacteriales archaeon QS_8_69_26]
MNGRRFLAAVAGGSAAVAGCLSSVSGSDPRGCPPASDPLPPVPSDAVVETTTTGRTPPGAPPDEPPTVVHEGTAWRLHGEEG